MAESDGVRDTIIIGSGPAGLTAAIYAARSRCCPLVIHGHQPGGQLTTTTVIENFPGFETGIDGPALMVEMQKQAARFGTDFYEGKVTSVDLSATPFRIQVEDELLRCHTLIVATGASPKMLGLPNEWDLYGRGVSVCATCDGFFFRGKEVVVVGGGDTAIEDAIFLTRFARKVTVIHRRDTLRATPTLQQRALKHEEICFRWQSRVAEIVADASGVTGVKVQNLTTGTVEEMSCDGLFIAIGHHPNTELFRGQLELDPEGYIVSHNHAETSIPGVFAAGDVQDPHFRQAITAAASGCVAALQAERYLETLQEQ